MVPNKVELLCARAQQAMAARDWDKAKQYYLLALDFRADTAEVHYGLATVYFQQGDMANAAHHYMEVTRLEPSRARAFINLGAALHKLGEFEDAEIALCKGLQIDSRLGEGFYLLGLVHKSRRQIDKALLAFTEALRCNPRLAEALLGKGEAHIAKYQPELALSCIEEALRLRPNWDKALLSHQVAHDMVSRLPTRKTEQDAVPEAIGGSRTVDPETDRVLLTELHQLAGFTEKKGELLVKILGEQLAPLLVELSRLLINPKSLRSDLATCLTQFESALERMHSARAGLEEEASKVRQLASRFPTK
jgi:tetratricopeptide (TPR) repeat protein